MNQLQQFVAQLGGKRLAIMAAVAVALLGALALVAMRGDDPQQGYLYTDLDPTAAAAISDKLKAANVPFTLSADGTAVLAPQDRLAELRMQLAGDRLGGKIGYEVLDEEQPFGMSASRAKLNETRAIEGELARSIESLDAVSRARVHIVLPERAMFAAEARRASAAVTVKTLGRLPDQSVQAIRNLVASSVPDLAPEAVSVVDQTGALLARAGDAGIAGASDADERQRAIEGQLREEIVALLEPIIGQGKVRAEVAAQVDRDQSREESNVFDPDKQVIAHQVTVESSKEDREQGASEPASVANQLPEAQAAPAPAAAGDQRQSAGSESSEDTTYANSATKSVVTRAPGRLTRLTVAVMVDGGEKGLPAPQIQRLTRLVENAVGIDAERGDSVVVESMRFTPEQLPDGLASGWMDSLPVDQLMTLLKLVVVAGAGLIALRMLRPKAAAEGEAPTLSAPDPALLALADRAAAGDQEALAQLENRQQDGAVPLLDHDVPLDQVDGRIKNSVLSRVGEAVAANPPEAAAVLRQWMNA